MSEDDYNLISTLQRLKMAAAAIGEAMPIDGAWEGDQWATMRKELALAILRLERKVADRMDEPKE